MNYCSISGLLTRRAAMTSVRLGFAALAMGLSGCAVGYGVDTTVATTAPWHDHQDDLADAPDVGDPPQPTANVKANWGTFLPYYALPVGFQMGTATGPARSWGNAKLLSWQEIAVTPAPEVGLKAVFTAAVPVAGGPTIHGVVTSFSWYIAGATRAGRVTTHLVVVDAAGKPIWQGDHSTLARAASPTALLRAHAAEWLHKPEFLAVVQ